jgi:hypothetical protein
MVFKKIVQARALVLGDFHFYGDSFSICPRPVHPADVYPYRATMEQR